MTGRYLILTPVESQPNEKRFDAAWRKFVSVCRSLHRDGLDYNVHLSLTDSRPHVLITASGKARPRKQPAAHRVALPPPITAQRCRERALEAEWFLPENQEKRNGNTSYWGKHKARYQELSSMAEEFIRAEAEYWRDMELLSGRREHFKPGRTDEAGHVSDEVAA